MVWMRPTVEGHMGYKWVNGEKVENGISGTTNATWTGDLWKTGGAATWNGATYDPETNLASPGTGNPLPGTATCAPATTCSLRHRAHRPGYRQDRLALPDHLPTTAGTLTAWNEFVSPTTRTRRPAPIIKAGGKADRNGFFFVLDRTNGKPLNIFPSSKQITWATGFDMTTGRPNYVDENRPGDPGSDGKKGKTSSLRRPSSAAEPAADRLAHTGLFYVPGQLRRAMDIWNEPVSYKRGAAYLGAGFTIKALNDDYIGAARDGSGLRQDRLGKQELRSLWGGPHHRGQPDSTVAPRRLPEGAGCQDRQGSLVVPDRLGRGGSPVTWMEGGEQYVAVVSGWGGAVPCGGRRWPVA